MLKLEHADQEQKIPAHMNFVMGGIAGAILDTLKDGLQCFYLGWSAAFLRQLTYTTTRLGIYNSLYDLGQDRFGELNYSTMFGIGMLAGVMGAFVGTPADLVFVRMVGDLKLPKEKRKNYRHAIAALIDVTKKEGVRALWKGAVPTMTRAAIVNGTQLGTFSKSKLMLLETGLFREGILLSFCSAIISGLAMSVASLPVDVAKTRSQNWSEATRAPGILLTLITILRNEGAPALWRGFLPYYIRAAPNAVITMISLDYLKHSYTTHLLAYR